MALSFAEVSGCKKVWEEISRAQSGLAPPGADPGFHAVYGTPGLDDAEMTGDDAAYRSHAYDNYMENSLLGDDARQAPGGQYFPLPVVSRGSLDSIVQAFNENLMGAPGLSRDKIISELCNNKFAYINNLLEVFTTCEDLEDVEGLQLLYQIFRSIFLLADPETLKHLLSPNKMMDVVGILEYDPEYYSTSTTNGEVLLHRHREFLKNKVEYKAVVQIDDSATLQKIHQNYWINYIKDVILPRTLDDGTLAALSHLIEKNNNDIALHFLTNSSGVNALRELFARLKSDEEGARKSRRNDLRLLVELCALSKSMIVSNREKFHNSLLELGLLDLCTNVMRDEETEIQLLGAEMISAALVQDQASVFNFVQSQEVEDSLISGLVLKLNADTDAGVILEVLEILRTLLDPESISSDADRSKFLNLFYEKFMEKVLTALKDIENSKENSKMLRSSLCDLLSSCVVWHGYRSKYFVLRLDVVNKVLNLLKTDSSYVAVSAIRFFRACVGMEDDYYNRYIVKKKLLAPIAKIFKENENKDNLLNSAVLELLDFISKESLRVVLVDLMEHYAEYFDSIRDSPIFEKAKKAYEDSLTAGATSTGNTNGTEPRDYSDRTQFGLRGAAKNSAPDLDEDEAYFESDDGDDMQDQQVGPNPPPSYGVGGDSDNATVPFPTRREREGSSDEVEKRSCSLDVPKEGDDDSHVHSSSGPQPLVDYPNEDEDTDDELPKGENGERSSLGISLKMESGQVSASAKLDEDEGIVEDQSATSNAEEGQASPPDQKRRRVKEEEESERGT
mmetsp:Transcript_15901/g.64981  ORF Transcript_15901/g.64981 Transcript_15901/m.64981 type:complete len:790 (-) Transcript_15901:3024-5393(-)